MRPGRTFDNTFTQRFGLTALNGLVFADEQGQRLDLWDARPLRGSQLIEHTAAGLNGIGPANEYTDRAVRVTAVRITSTGDSPGAPSFTVLSNFPFYVDSGQTSFVDVEYAGSASGSLTGTLEVDCDDQIEPTLRIPLAVTVVAVGPSAALQIAPTPLDLGATPVGATIGANLTITNSGSRDAIIDGITFTREDPAGQFAFPRFASVLAPGQSDPLYVSCRPTFMGAATAVLTIEIHSETAVGQRLSPTYDVALEAVGQQPTIFFAGGPMGRRPRPTRPLQLLDFGAGPPDTDLTASFWIRNTGNAGLEVGALNENVSCTVPDAASRFPAVIRPGGELEVPSAYRTSAVPGQSTTATLRLIPTIRPTSPLTCRGGQRPKDRTSRYRRSSSAPWSWSGNLPPPPRRSSDPTARRRSPETKHRRESARSVRQQRWLTTNWLGWSARNPSVWQTSRSMATPTSPNALYVSARWWR